MSVTRCGLIRTIAASTAGLTLGFVLPAKHARAAASDTTWASAVNA